MKKSFYSNLAFLLFVNLLVKPFWILGIDRGVQNAQTVGTENYGLYFSLFGVAFIFQFFLDFGITNFNNRSVAQDENFIGINLFNILVLKVLLAVFYAVLIFTAAIFLNYNSHEVFLLSLLGATQVATTFLLYVRSNISGLHLFKVDSVLSVFDKLMMIVICGYLLWGPFKESFTIEWFIYAQIGSLLITLIIASAIVMRKASNFKLGWNFSGVIRILKRTCPYALLGLLMSVYYRIDGVMLERMLPDGDYEAGVYAASFRLLDAVNMLGFLFASMLLPIFSRMLSEKKDVHLLTGSSFKTIMVAASFIVAACFFFRNEIIGLLYHDATDYWSEVFGMLMPAFLGICAVYIYGSLLTANGSMKALNSIALGGMLLNIILNFMLIPQYKAFGATIATLITQTLVAAAHIYAAKKILPFEINIRQVIIFLIFIAGMIGVFIGAREVTGDWLMNLVIGSVASILLALALKIIDVGKMIALITADN